MPLILTDVKIIYEYGPHGLAEGLSDSLEFLWCFKDQYNGAAHIELAEQFALFQFYVGGQFDFIIAVCLIQFSPFQSGPFVCFQLFIDVHIHRTHIRGSYFCRKKIID